MKSPSLRKYSFHFDETSDLGMAKLVSRSATEVYDVYFMSGDVESLRYMSPEVASQQP